MNIPFFSLKRQWETHKKNLRAALDGVLESQYYIGGPTVQKFEQSFAQKVGASHAVSCNSGTDALWLALKALDLRNGDLVLTTPFSFIASSSEIVAHGAQPLFIDVDPQTYLIDPDAVEQWLEKHAILRDGKAVHTQTGAAIPGMVVVNIFGQCADFTRLNQIAKRWNLWIVEDAAQSIGASHKGVHSGALGTIATFSFYPTKNLGGCGDGGMTTTNDARLAQRLLQLRNHGRISHYEYREHGINSRLDALQAAFLQEKLSFIDNLNASRRRIAAAYCAALESHPNVHLPHIKDDGRHVFHVFGLRAQAADGTSLQQEFIAHLKQHGVGTNIFYPQTLDRIPFLVSDKRYKHSCPHATALAQSIVCLPVWPELTDEEVAYICSTAAAFMQPTHLAMSSDQATQ